MSVLTPNADRRQLGSLNCHPISYGHWRLADGDDANADAAYRKTRAALDAGMDMIDTAAIYGYPNFGLAEEIFGQALKANPGLRDEMLLATKGGIIPPTPYDSSKSHLIETCDASLKRLNTDVIDLFYVHRPDWLTPHQEVAEALVALKQSGKVKEVAVSNYTPSQFDALDHLLGGGVLVANQVEFSPKRQDPVWDGTLDLCQKHRAAFVAWSPLGGGDLLTQDPSEDSNMGRIAAVLDKIAARQDQTRANVALAWTLISHPNIVSIIGSQQTDRIADQARAMDVEMTRDEYYEVVVAWRGVGLP